MRRYPEYKESGVEWIREIPKHWVAKKIRFFCSMKSGNGFSHDLQGRTELEIPFFKVADTNTLDNKVEMLYAKNTVSSQDVFDFKFILHKPNSIVFPKVGAALLLNKRNILTQKSCIDNNMMSLYSDQSNHKFLYYAMLNVDFKRHYRAGRAVPSINESEIGNIPIAYPSLSEQTQIANFLDRKTEQIDEFIRIKVRQIELLLEQRTALINQAVTKGLDPNVEMKPSGVEWIGEIPKNWEVLKAKHVGLSNPSKNNSKTIYLKDELVVFLPMERVHTDGTIDQELRLPYSQLKNGYTYFEEGDILIAKVTPCFENGKIVHIKNLATSVGFGSTEFIVIRPDLQKVFPPFLYYILYNDPLRSIGKHFMTSAIGLKRVPTEFVENFRIPIPTYQEQAQIANFLDNKTEQIDELIDAEQRKIELLKEYRQSLISEAVTGKIDVRNEV